MGVVAKTGLLKKTENHKQMLFAGSKNTLYVIRSFEICYTRHEPHKPRTCDSHRNAQPLQNVYKEFAKILTL